MFLRIFLCSSVFAAASANSVIPAQTYPIYQQNGYMSPQANQPNNIQPYTQDAIVQNQLQQLNISPSTIKQALLNKLLTSQPLQTNLDTNAVGYGSNLNTAQNNLVPSNLANNNYALVPRDYLKYNSSYANIDTNVNSTDGKKAKKSKRRRSKSRRQKDSTNIPSISDQNEPLKPKTKRMKSDENPMESNKRSRKRTRKQKSQNVESEKDTNTDNKNKKPRRRRKKQKNQTTENPVDAENTNQNKKSGRRRKKKRINENSEIQDLLTKPKCTEIENIDLDISKERMSYENRPTRNLKLDVNDITKTIPSPAPKDITNNFMNQFKNPLIGGWFPNFGNLYQAMVQQPTVNETKPKRKRKTKKNKKTKKSNKQNRNITEEVTTKNSSTFSTDATIPENTVYINEMAQINVNPNKSEESLKSFETEDLSSNEIFKDGYNIDEFEDRYGTSYYGGYIDDYYPVFIPDSVAYNANNKEIILKNLNDSKYYYATDIIEANQTNITHEFAERLEMDVERNKHTYDDVEREGIRNAYEKEFGNKIEEQLQFRTPPHLTSPDFWTRQINRTQIKPEKYIEDKSSSYSNAKSTYNSGDKRNDIKSSNGIQIVNAKSKVVRYGPVYSPEEDMSPAATNQISKQDPSLINDSFRNGEITYVIAKSL